MYLFTIEQQFDPKAFRGILGSCLFFRFQIPQDNNVPIHQVNLVKTRKKEPLKMP